MVVKKYNNGDKYDGEWSDGMKNGSGILYYKNGGTYEGEWIDDMRSGHGKNIWADGNQYTGEWEDNKKNGVGTFDYADGGKYVGEWKNDMRNGQGNNFWANGDQYEGAWQDDEREGRGTFVYANGGNRYIGEWSGNMRHGFGLNKWSSGDRYEGLWRCNQKHGTGTLFHVDGSKEEGEWTDNIFSGSPTKELQKSTKKSDSKNMIQVKGLWLNGQPFLVLLMPTISGCAYQQLAREYIASLNWDDAFFDSAHDRCYCNRCYKDSWKDMIDAGDGQYVIPRTWVRLGLQIDPVTMKTQDIWNKWVVTYHGTSRMAAESIITHRQFCMPGDKLLDGTKLKIRPGHIPGQMFIYTSPTITYSSGPAYSPTYDFHSTQNDSTYEIQMVLQCRQKPKSFEVGPETIGAGNIQICPHIPNSEIEYFTDRRSSLLAYGLLVRFRSKNA